MTQFAAMMFLAVLVLRIVREHEMLVMYRPGRLYRIAGAGPLLLMPFVGKGMKVNLA